MNPQDRRLRLRKTTLLDLSPETATDVKGGLCSKWIETGSIFCTAACTHDTACQTRAFTNCEYCGPY